MKSYEKVWLRLLIICCWKLITSSNRRCLTLWYKLSYVNKFSFFFINVKMYYRNPLTIIAKCIIISLCLTIQLCGISIKMVCLSLMVFVVCNLKFDRKVKIDDPKKNFSNTFEAITPTIFILLIRFYDQFFQSKLKKN